MVDDILDEDGVWVGGSEGRIIVSSTCERVSAELVDCDFGAFVDFVTVVCLSVAETVNSSILGVDPTSGISENVTGTSSSTNVLSMNIIFVVGLTTDACWVGLIAGTNAGDEVSYFVSVTCSVVITRFSACLTDSSVFTTEIFELSISELSISKFSIFEISISDFSVSTASFLIMTSSISVSPLSSTFAIDKMLSASSSMVGSGTLSSNKNVQIAKCSYLAKKSCHESRLDDLTKYFNLEHEIFSNMKYFLK